jgi:SAM-dependent methyltransferase
LLAFFSLTLFVSAFILFLVQPMIGKMILPVLGGTPAVWNTCMVFFQAMLLIGYAYTHTLSSTQPRRRQLIVQSVLLFLPLLVLPFALSDRTAASVNVEYPVFWLLWILLGMVGLPFFVVATSAPLLQKWFATTGHYAAKDPYFLYGASNLGSMLGLLLYPALIEPAWDVPTQALVWTAGYCLLIACVLGCALLVARTPEPAPVIVHVSAEPLPLPAPVPERAMATAVTAGPVATGRRRGVRLGAAPVISAEAKGGPGIARKEPSRTFWQSLMWTLFAKDEADPVRDTDTLTVGRRIRWVLLAAVPSSLMLGVTTYFTTDIASVPSFWVVPLAVYLLTFILVFARWPVVWTSSWPHTVVLYLQPCFLLFLVLRMVGNIAVSTLLDFLLHLGAFFFTTLLCHGELAKDRPSPRHLTEFYLWMAVGGVVGGLFNALVAPIALPFGVIEYPLAMVVACLLRPYMAQDITEGSGLAVPHSVGDAGKLALDSMLFGLGMSTFSAGTTSPTERRSLPGRLRRLAPSSNLLELLLDLLVPIAFGVFTYFMVYIGDHEKTVLGIQLKRSYTMMAVVIFALALALRPLRFGLAVAAVFLVSMAYDRSYENLVFEGRSFFGLVRVRQWGDAQVRRTMIHGGINHGQQIVSPEPLRRQPITYFHPTNGIGELFHKLTWGSAPGKKGSPEHTAWMQANYWTDPPKKIAGESSEDFELRYSEWFHHFLKLRAHFYPGDPRMPASMVGLGAVSPWAQLVGTQQQVPFAVIGLGTGTLAAHAQPMQVVDFYEIDPMVKRLSVPDSGEAKDLIFYFVDDALKRGALLDIKLGDGRLKIKEAPEKYYHALLVDAFSSDAVPMHLLTKEAVSLYFDKLADGGVLIFNTTNRYVRLQPRLARIAEELNLECLGCPDYTNDNIPEKFGADWLAMRRRDKPGVTMSGGPSLYDRLQMSEDRWQKIEPDAGRVWTDSYSNLLGAMRW